MKLPSVYEPKEYESNIYSLWEQSGAFVPDENAKDYFSMVMPPPNANGDLHLGHALTGAVEDIIVRYHRMQGKATLLVPGADHAGFETWVVFEKKLQADGKSRFDYSREQLYEQVWDFVQLNKGTSERQWRSMGVSCDWSRFTFTLDNKVVATSYSTFKKMWHDGLIYRGNRIVNFCTYHGTSFSDIEVEHVEEHTKLWHIAYPLAGGGGELVIATTRPETKLGQAALMVNPKDERYTKFVGQSVLQPLVPDRPIPVIADEHVDMKFGTGVVTVTPGHDPNDYEVAKRHGLPVTELITEEGKMSDAVPEKFRGMTVAEARVAVADELETTGYIRGVEDHTHTIGVCYKCGTTIEPLVREQWFITMQPLAKQAIAALKDKRIIFHPAAKLPQAIKYLESIKDWNISRQIAWGIPIPAFQNVEDGTDWIYDERVTEETIEVMGKSYRRDPDVFDTWFSSGHWPQVCLDYPAGDDFKRFYPLNLMETGFDILNQWVLRMIMLGIYTTGQVPFREVYLHGLVLDEHDQKMSKSKGNVVEPVKIIDDYGSDAMRLGIIEGRTAGQNQPFGLAKVKAGRNFCNKLWNIARFCELTIGDGQSLKSDPKPLSTADHWILTKLQHTTASVTTSVENYRLAQAYETLYHFVWDDVADWYVEASKIETNKGMLAYVLECVLKLAHPFAPFITETIWQTLAWEQGSLLIAQRWPAATAGDKERTREFEHIKTIVSESRQIITQLQAPKPTLYYTDVPFLSANAELLKRLAGLAGVMEVRAGHGLHLTKTPFTCWLDIDQHTARRHVEKLVMQRTERAKAIKRLNDRLSDKQYTAHAPKAIVAQTRQQLLAEQATLSGIEQQIQAFNMDEPKQ